MATSIRTERVNELILKQLTLIFNNKVKDPRLQHVQICQVVSSRDLSFCRVFFTTDKDKTITTDLLNKKSGFLRSQLAVATKLRHTPKLQFHYDPTPETGERIDNLLAKINASA